MGGAGLLAVVVEKPCAFFGYPVDVGCSVPHQAIAIGANIGDADVIAVGRITAVYCQENEKHQLESAEITPEIRTKLAAYLPST